MVYVLILAAIFVCIYGAAAGWLYYGYNRKMTL